MGSSMREANYRGNVGCEFELGTGSKAAAVRVKVSRQRHHAHPALAPTLDAQREYCPVAESVSLLFARVPDDDFVDWSMGVWATSRLPAVFMVPWGMHRYYSRNKYTTVYSSDRNRDPPEGAGAPSLGRCHFPAV